MRKLKIFPSSLSYRKALFVIILNFLSQMRCWTSHSQEWIDFAYLIPRLVFRYQFIPFAVSDLPHHDGWWTHQDREPVHSPPDGGRTFPQWSHLDGVLTSWNCCIPMAPLFFLWLCFIPVTLCYALQVHREPWIIISHILSQPYLSVCMSVSTRNTTWIHR